jgi:hypothetical protein
MSEHMIFSQLTCENCGKGFEVDRTDSPLGASYPMYCPGCQDWLEWQREEASHESQ